LFTTVYQKLWPLHNKHNQLHPEADGHIFSP